MDTVNIKELNERIKEESAFVDILSMEMSKVIVGQKHLIENLLIGLLANGHILLEGVPGLAKTLAINTLASSVNANFNRIQFTPDLLPADVLGTLIYSQKSEQFQIKKGPIFANLFWRMRLTVLLRKFSLPFWRLCRSVRLLSVMRPSNFPNHSW
jgi:MoxR-like ATPase